MNFEANTRGIVEERELSVAQRKMDEAEFSSMLGQIGASFVGKRIFAAICPKGADHIFLKDYIIYCDTVRTGTKDEKDLISFKMLDIKAEGRITFQLYERFWKEFLFMYSQLFNYKIDIDEQSTRAALNAF